MVVLDFHRAGAMAKNVLPVETLARGHTRICILEHHGGLVLFAQVYTENVITDQCEYETHLALRDVVGQTGQFEHAGGTVLRRGARREGATLWSRHRVPTEEIWRASEVDWV